jgi:hypothetical protein
VCPSRRTTDGLVPTGLLAEHEAVIRVCGSATKHSFADGHVNHSGQTRRRSEGRKSIGLVGFRPCWNLMDFALEPVQNSRCVPWGERNERAEG